MHYREADDEYFAVVEEHTEVFHTLGRTKFPKSYQAMFMFCAKTNSLKTAMFDCIDSNNPYAFKVLFRCFCEHYLKFMYVWARLLSESSDSVGTEYYSFCGAVEAREYAGAITMAEGLLGNSVTANVREALAKLYPEAVALSDRELDEASRQFRYRSILRYFAGSKVKLVSGDQPFLAQIVPLYATLSSFVHGGPYTDMEMAEYSEPRALQECEREVEVVFMMTATVFMLTAMAVSREHPEFVPVAPKVNRILKQFAGTHGET
jgi:hypothetical protein